MNKPRTLNKSQDKYDVMKAGSCHFCGRPVGAYWALCGHLRVHHLAELHMLVNDQSGGYVNTCPCGKRLQSVTHEGGLFDHWLSGECPDMTIRRWLVTEALK